MTWNSIKRLRWPQHSWLTYRGLASTQNTTYVKGHDTCATETLSQAHPAGPPANPAGASRRNHHIRPRHPARPRRPARLGRPRARLVLLVVTMDTSILFFAAPHLAADLRPSATELLWTTSMACPRGSPHRPMGSLADSLGRRRVLLGADAVRRGLARCGVPRSPPPP